MRESNRRDQELVPRADEPEVGERRAFLGAFGSLLGTSVGVSMLAGCVDGGGDQRGSAEPEAVALIGSTPVKWVDTVNIDLRSAAGCVQSEVVIARGFASANDGGGGIFSWDAKSASGDDGGTVIVPTTQCGTPPGRWVRIYSGALDVRWFGARAGSASFAAQNDIAIQKAIGVATPVGGIDAGRVFFPPGQWYIATPISIVKDDSVILVGPGGAGLWDATGAYDHYSAKIIWCGTGAAAMVDFASTMRCGVTGLMLDGGGTATCGIRLRTTDAPSKGNCFDDVVIRNLAASGIGFHVGTNPDGNPTYVNPDVAFNKLTRFWIIGGAIGVLQEGNQTVAMVFEDGVVTAMTSYGMKFLGGDVNVSRCFFGADAAATAEVYVGVKAQYARFVGNTHETVCRTSYLFEPTTATALRPMATLMLGVRVLYQRSTGTPRRIIDFQQDGHLTLLSCTFDGYVIANAPEVYLAPPLMGYADTGLINDIGCRYLNGARAVVAPIAGAYQSLLSGGVVGTPPYTPYMGEHMSSGLRHRLHNSCLELQDNHPIAPQQPGVRLSTKRGRLRISSVTPRAATERLLELENENDDPRMIVNAAGGPRFFHQPLEQEPPDVRPTVTGSRGGNAALASLLEALAKFGLITNNTTP